MGLELDNSWDVKPKNVSLMLRDGFPTDFVSQNQKSWEGSI